MCYSLYVCFFFFFFFFQAEDGIRDDLVTGVQTCALPIYLENNAIFLGSLDSQEKRLLVSTSANAAYAEPGYLLYLREKTLVAQPLDPRRYVLSGEPRTLSDEVLYFPQVDRAVFSVSSGEVLVTQTGKGASLSQLSLFDRSGKSSGTVGTPGIYNNVRLSPDGRRVASDH